MKLGLDLRCLPTDGSEGAGVAHATRSLCSRLCERKDIEWLAFVPKGAKWEASEKINLENTDGDSLRRALAFSPCDLLFVPSGAIARGLNISAVPWVHDLIIFEHPEWFPQSWFKRQMTTRLFLRGIKSAPIVFCVSEYTKKAIIKYTNIPAERIIVTGEGGDEALIIISDQDLQNAKNKAIEFCNSQFGLHGPFILSLGTIEPRKNLAMLIRAWRNSIINQPEKPLDLVIAGADGWKYADVNEEIAKIPETLVNKFHRINFFDDNSKRQLLLATKCVAIPSLDEGYGLVAHEALQAGTMVLASRAGALPEVAGQGGILLDPKDEQAWSQAILDLQKTDIQIIRPGGWSEVAEKVLNGLEKLG